MAKSITASILPCRAAREASTFTAAMSPSTESRAAAGTPPSTPPVPPRMLWIGGDDGDELGAARRWLAGRLEAAGGRLLHADDPGVAVAAAGDDAPAVAILAADRPGRWTLRDAVALSRRWPLMPIVSVASSLVDGRRRSGPPLPGIEEVFWHDLPGRCERWLADLEAGRAGTLGLPATARREERLLEAVRPGGRPTHDGPRPPGVSVVAERADDLDGLVELLTVAGRTILRRGCGRPQLDEPADLLVWDVAALSRSHLAWLGMLSANRPGLRIVVLESFPRGDSTQAAIRAGAAAVLGRPVQLDALEALLLRLEGPGTVPSAGRAG
jgi:hypothetical protein